MATGRRGAQWEARTLRHGRGVATKCDLSGDKAEYCSKFPMDCSALGRRRQQQQQKQQRQQRPRGRRKAVVADELRSYQH